MNKEKILDLGMVVSKLLLWGLSILGIYWLILKITGHSPTADQIIISMLGIMIATFFAFAFFVIRSLLNIREDLGSIKQHIKHCDKRFYALASDYKKHIDGQKL